MRERTFRLVIAGLCLLSHVVAVLTVIIAGAYGRFNFSNEVPQIMAALMPIFATTVTTLVKYAAANIANNRQGRTLSTLFVGVTSFIAIVLSISVVGSVLASSLGMPGLSHVPNLVIVLATIETSFAVHFAVLFSAIFPLQETGPGFPGKKQALTSA